MTKGKGKLPGFGGLDKHVKRSEYKERGQLQHRKHLGGLEKHKDYVKRAKVRQAKVARVRQLKRAVAMRNPDEFNMKMTDYVMDMATGKMKKKSKKQPKQIMSEEILRETKDATYLDNRSRADERRAHDLMGELAAYAIPPFVAPGGNQKRYNRHTLFVDDEEQVKHFNAAAALDTTTAALRHVTPFLRP